MKPFPAEGLVLCISTLNKLNQPPILFPSLFTGSGHFYLRVVLLFLGAALRSLFQHVWDRRHEMSVSVLGSGHWARATGHRPLGIDTPREMDLIQLG